MRIGGSGRRFGTRLVAQNVFWRADSKAKEVAKGSERTASTVSTADIGRACGG